jgi:hypothetical protein
LVIVNYIILTDISDQDIFGNVANLLILKMGA